MPKKWVEERETEQQQKIDERVNDKTTLRIATTINNQLAIKLYTITHIHFYFSIVLLPELSCGKSKIRFNDHWSGFLCMYLLRQASFSWCILRAIFGNCNYQLNYKLTWSRFEFVQFWHFFCLKCNSLTDNLCIPSEKRDSPIEKYHRFNSVVYEME